MDFRSKRFIFNEQNPLPYNVIIVDEVSMVDVPLMCNLLKAVARDTKLIFVGDKDQLPSVGAGNVLEDMLTSGVISVAELTQIYRQSEKSLIISNAHKINEGEMPEIDNKSQDFFFDAKVELDIGYIHSIDVQTGEVEIWFEDGRECIYPRTELSQLSLAYAITIHKSQGSEFDVVIIPIISGPSLILNRNLIYTAVTRAKKMVVLVGEKKNLKRMIGNKFILKRHTALKKLLIDAYKKANILFN